MLIRFFFFFFLIHLVTSISNQEDLSISNYSHIGCLILKPDKQFISNSIQENALFPYQTFSSSSLTIELCFRLCRQWIILMNDNHTNCICVYTMSVLYEINEHLGEVLPINNCTSNALKIYSLTKDPYLLPSPTPYEDWSFEGCYYLHGIQIYHANLRLNDVNYTRAIDLCRKHCQSIRSPGYFSFFLSLKKFCYCLPIKLSPSITTTGVRIPLIHCSFLSYIKNGFEKTLNFSEINSDTVVKINVQRYCSSAFIFDRNLYLCLRIALLDTSNSYAKISPNETCSPVLIKTYEQWNHLISFSSLLRLRTFIWIDQKSTYIVDDLFKSKVSSLGSNDLCVIINRMQLLSFDLIPCSTVRSPGYVFCTQKPVDTVISDQSELKPSEQFPVVENISCPTGFVLFNNLCYYVDTSFVYTIRLGERLCSDKYRNSTLVKFNSHVWGNVNTTRFLGRTFDDILLEFFYYQLENKFLIETKNNTNKKHWLRLLIGDKNNPNQCVLRYFIRSTGAFTILHRCSDGGHPVCQCQPIAMNETINQIIIESSTTKITVPFLSNSTHLPVVSNETIVPVCDNCTNLIADEDLLNNETNTEYILDYNNTLTTKSPSKYHLFWITVTGLLLAFVILVVGIVFLIRYVRHSRGSYSTRSSCGRIARRTKCSSKSATTDDISNTPAVLYTRLTSPLPSIIIDADMTNSFDNPIINDDKIQLLPQPINPTSLHENLLTDNEEEEEPLYATLKVPNEK